MTQDDEDRFRVRPGTPRARQQRFISRVIAETSKAGGNVLRTSKSTGARHGRGYVAVRFAGQALGSRSRRVIVKTRLVVLKKVGAHSTATHLRYIERASAGKDQAPGQAYGPVSDTVDLSAFEQQGRGDRHQFRLIVSQEDGVELNDLRGFTRDLISRMEADLGTRLEWVAVDHWDTDNPHTHIVLRGKDDAGHDLVIARDYISRGMRQRASALATEWLGPRTELEIRNSLVREIDQERWTNLDRALQRAVQDGVVRLDTHPHSAESRQYEAMLRGRLQRLHTLGLANQVDRSAWSIRDDAEVVLRAMGERGDIIRTMQRALGHTQRELTIFNGVDGTHTVTGRIAAKGLVNELHDRGFLVVEGVDGRGHYVALNHNVDLREYPVGGIVAARFNTQIRQVDKTIAALTIDGIYRTDQHRAVARNQTSSRTLNPDAVVDMHVRRLEALRRLNLVERITEGVWRVPTDLSERVQTVDSQKSQGASIELQSHLSVAQQKRAIGTTWLDKQLIGGMENISARGFGADVRDAVNERANFLIEQGLAERRDQRIILARNLLATLRDRDIEATARAISAEIGLTHHQPVDGERLSGIYRRSVQLVSGRFAMLDNSKNFCLVPWRPVIENRLGQTVMATIQNNAVSWELGTMRIHPL